MFTLPPLSYAFSDLEPHLDAETMEIHYSKHHQTYCDNFNKVLATYPELAELSADELIANLNKLKVTDEDRIKIRNFGGGFINHNLYWQEMNPDKLANEALRQDIVDTFGSIDSFKEQFTALATKHFGSGWAWLVRDQENKLRIYSLPNQDSPLTIGHTPVLTLDVWEHAYYLKYKNKRADFIAAWWNVVKI